MKHNLAALFCRILFGLGLALSQMINPGKVQGFLDIAGNWDPSLAFVMLGALAVAGICFRLVLRRSAPLLADAFHVSKKTIIDRHLICGAAIFGIGWGITGYCPGPAVANLGLLNREAVLMIGAIYAGFFAHKWLFKKH